VETPNLQESRTDLNVHAIEGHCAGEWEKKGKMIWVRFVVLWQNLAGKGRKYSAPLSTETYERGENSKKNSIPGARRHTKKGGIVAGLLVEVYPKKGKRKVKKVASHIADNHESGGEFR